MSDDKGPETSNVDPPVRGDGTITFASGGEMLLNKYYAKGNNHGMKFFRGTCFLNFQGLCLDQEDCPWKHSMLLENIPDDPVRCIAILGHAVSWEYYVWLELALKKIVPQNRFDKSILKNLVNQAADPEQKKKLLNIIMNPETN